MFQVLVFTLFLGADTPVQDQANLAAKLAEALANVTHEQRATVYVASLPPRFTLKDALPSFPLIGSVVQMPIQSSHPALMPPRRARSPFDRLRVTAAGSG